MQKEGVEAIVQKILDCDENTLARLKRALGTSDRQTTVELVREDPDAIRTVRAVFGREPTVPVGDEQETTADRMFPSNRRKKTKMDF